MKNFALHFLDWMVPPDIKEFDQSEEHARARALVAILASNLFLSAVALVLLLVDLIPVIAEAGMAVFGMVFSVLGYIAALTLFKKTASFFLGGNFFAIIVYTVSLMGSFIVPSSVAANIFIVMLPMPFLVALVANFGSGLFWVAAIGITPILAAFAGVDGISPLFQFSWMFACVGALLTIVVGHYYRSRIVQRLSSERTRFEFAAAHDALTGLSNRATFDRRLRECIEYCTLHGARSMLVYIDLDRFKPINDEYGHQAGDVVLTTVAERLRQFVRKTDTVARLGGDEFAILFDRCLPDDVAMLIKRVTAAVSEPIEVFGHQLCVGCSIGVVHCPDDGMQPHQLSHKADERMYEAKRRQQSPT
jgi:diguanylate cyclase (GGDEF)-like protein